MKKKKVALVFQKEDTGKQVWFIPSHSKNTNKVVSLLENGQDYFRKHFITETMDLTIFEFLEIIDAFDYIDYMKSKE